MYKLRSKSIITRVSALFMTVIMLTGITDISVFNTFAQDMGTNVLNEWEAYAWWSVGDNTRPTEKTDIKDTAGVVEVKLDFQYDVSSCKQRYNPGDIVIKIDGMKMIKRNGMVIGDTIGIDEYGASANDNMDWDVSYDFVTDTFTYVNKNVFYADDSKQGGFDIIWRFNSRDGINNFSKTIHPTFTVCGETINLPALNYTYQSVEDEFNLSIGPIPGSNGVVSGAYYETADKTYIWKPYRVNLTQTYKARGINASRLFVEVELPEEVQTALENGDATSDHLIIRRANSNQNINLQKIVVGDKTVWGFYVVSSKSDDYSTYNYWDYYIGYNKEEFSSKNVKLNAYFERRYNDEKDPELLKSDTNNDYYDDFSDTVNDYQLSYGGYGISFFKDCGYDTQDEGKKLIVNKLYDGVDIAFTLRANTNMKYNAPSSTMGDMPAGAPGAPEAPGAPDGAAGLPSLRSGADNTGLTEDTVYDLVIGDDDLAIALVGGGYRKLSGNEYYFKYVTLPGAGGKKVDIYVSNKVDPTWSDYKLMASDITPNGKAYTLSYPDETDNKVRSFYIKVKDCKGTFGYSVTAGLYVDLDKDAELAKEENNRIANDGHIINYGFMRMLYDNALQEYDYAGVSSPQYCNVTDVDTVTQIGNDDENYGNFVRREYAKCYLREVSVMMGSKTSWEPSRMEGSSNTGYNMDVITSGEIVNPDAAGELRKFALYSILPKEFNMSESLFSNSNFISGFAYDTSGLEVDNDAFESHVSDIEIKTLSDGRKVIYLEFDFSDRPLELSKRINVSVNYTTSIDAKVLDACTDQNFTIESRTAVLDNGYIVIRKNTTEAGDTNKWNEVRAEPAVTGNNDLLLAGSYHRDFLARNPSSWQNRAIKAAKRGDSIDYSRDFEVDTAEKIDINAYNENAGADNSNTVYTYEIGISLRDIRTEDIVLYDYIEGYSSTKTGGSV